MYNAYKLAYATPVHISFPGSISRYFIYRILFNRSQEKKRTRARVPTDLQFQFTRRTLIRDASE